MRAAATTIEDSVHDKGFNVAATMPEAARRGSMGLMGMIERMRLIDGTCRAYSSPGMGTTVTLAFERISLLAAPAADSPLAPTAQPQTLRPDTRAPAEVTYLRRAAGMG